MKRNNQRGYIALSLILVVLSVVLVIGISTSLLSVNDLLSSQSGEKGKNSLDLVESCVEDSLLRLNEDNSLPATITIAPLSTDSCSISINSQSGNNWDYTVSGTKEGYTRSIRLQVIRSSTVSITSWIEN